MRKRSVTIQANDKKKSRVNQKLSAPLCVMCVFPQSDARHMHNQWLKLAQILDLVFTLDFFSWHFCIIK